MIYTESEVQNLQNRIIELERRLAEAQATISTLTSLKQDKFQRNAPPQYEQILRVRVEEALRESKERFAKAFHASPNAITISRLSDGLIIEVNEGWRKILGHEQDEILGRTTLDVGIYVNPADREKAIRLLMENGFLRDFDLDIRHKSGKIRQMSMSAELLEINGTNCLLTVLQDITDRKQLEILLRKRESILVQAGEMAHLGAWDIEFHNQEDVNANPLSWSDEVYRIFGYTPKEVKPSNELFFERVHPDDRKLVQESVAQAIVTKRPYVIEHRIRRPTGEERIVQEHGEVFFDEAGKPLRIVGAVQDITERKRAEETARQQAQLLNLSSEAIFVWEFGGSIKYWNHGAEILYGYDRQQAIGQVSHELLATVHPRGISTFLTALERDGAWRGELIHRTREGRVVIVESSQQLVNQEGRKLVLETNRDISGRKQVEQALRASEERFRSLADSMPQLVWTALPDGTVDYYNSRSREYWEIKQVGKTTWDWAQLLHPEDWQATSDAWQHSVDTGEAYQIEHRVRMADGSYRWHLSRGAPTLDEKGQIIRWFGTTTDIHDLKLAEEQSRVYAKRLERSNRELEEFAFMASHDLQEPLRKIEMFGDLLLDESKGLNDQGRNYLNRMQNAAARMHAMVEGLLQLSRVATRTKPFVRVNLSQVILEVLSALGDQIRRTSARLEFDPLPAVEGDPLQLQQLMQNLIGNALKYHKTDIPPEVKISARQLPEKVQIFVEDKGIGFDQKDAERIFQPFQRLVGRSQYEGSGMGLAICQRIVERHGGEIVAHSKPEQGTTFIVTLPVNHAEKTKSD